MTGRSHPAPLDEGSRFALGLGSAARDDMGTTSDHEDDDTSDSRADGNSQSGVCSWSVRHTLCEQSVEPD